ncbi:MULTISPECIES: hypothetical protein [Vibrio]|uniref:Uncharacterized protein n=1 Tax=Vibrio neptunius TaxID=170651 RepID=A0ABS3A2T7_9VIBR|nr:MULTISPECIES: hypothetical protein [Vibrio]MBN3494014.1 hypothetical protein [Vibrio neptunius]MBN3516511.1 hypothetical protein [Vibrio neptunius]MBN3550685.1 hypothetical protein [Vibrio neptunius]MBN3578816.1 hypothetical protein [Vibrio neptunius]MCH9872481.1 hypothetical protein [Vibrio neptunius]
MAQRLIKFFWLTLLTMVLPTQAMAYFTQAENEASARLAPPTTDAAPQSQADYQTLFEESQQEETSQNPVSQSEIDTDVLAIVHFNRWSLSDRHSEEGEAPGTSDGHYSSQASLPLNSLYTYSLFDNGSWVENSFTSNHRISGWKESNALYVALNAQFI